MGNANEPGLCLLVTNPFLGGVDEALLMASLEGLRGVLSCRRKTDIAISVGAGHCALWNN
jgi:hypothetical protein